MNILGCGLALGETALANAALSDVLPADVIERKTGIQSRRRSTRSTAELAALALGEALRDAGLRPDQLAGFLLSTNSGDQWVPPTATAVAGRLGLRCAAMDLNAACAGGLHALRLTAAFQGPVAVVAAETVSRFARRSPGDWCSAIFGDGAAAVIVEAPIPWLGASWGTAPEYWDLMTVLPPEHLGHLEGRALFAPAVRLCAEALTEACRQAGLRPDALGILVPHQANLRLLEATAAALSIPMDRVVTTIQHTGNLSSASLLVALVTGLRSGQIAEPARVGFVAFGAGVSWGATVGTVRYVGSARDAI